MEDLLVEQLHEAAHIAEVTRIDQVQAAEQAKRDAKAAREEAQRKKNANKQRGSGVWARYEYISAEEVERRRLAKMIVTTGTRRGGRFKPEDLEEEAGQDQNEEPQRIHEVAGEKEREEEADVAGPSGTQGSGEVVDQDQTRAEQLATDEPQQPVAGPSRQRTPDATRAKLEPSVTPSKIKVNHETIYISDYSTADSDVCEAIDDPTEAMIAVATRATERRRARDSMSDLIASPIVCTNRRGVRVPRTGVDYSDTDSDCRILPDNISVPLSRMPRAPSEQRIQASDKSRIKDSSSSGSDRVETRYQVSPAAEVNESESPTRPRGRPKGSGWRQKAAAKHAAKERNKQKRPAFDSEESIPREDRLLRLRKRVRRDSQSRASPNPKSSQDRARSASVPELSVGPSSATSGTDLLTGLETTLTDLERPTGTHYDWMIESLDHYGSLTFKSMGKSGGTPFPPEEIVRDYVDMEHGEFLRLMKPQSRRSSIIVPCHRDSSDLPNGKDRLLPGQSRLVNEVEIKRWNPSRMKTPRPDKASTRRCNPTLPHEEGIEIVGYTVDTYACTSGQLSFDNGPWQKGQWRMIASRPRAPEVGKRRGVDRDLDLSELGDEDIIVATNHPVKSSGQAAVPSAPEVLSQSPSMQHPNVVGRDHDGRPPFSGSRPILPRSENAKPTPVTTTQTPSCRAIAPKWNVGRSPARSPDVLPSPMVSANGKASSASSSLPTKKTSQAVVASSASTNGSGPSKSRTQASTAQRDGERQAVSSPVSVRSSCLR